MKKFCAYKVYINEEARDNFKLRLTESGYVEIASVEEMREEDYDPWRFCFIEVREQRVYFTTPAGFTDNYIVCVCDLDKFKRWYPEIKLELNSEGRVKFENDRVDPND